MNKNISISLFRVSGDRKYLDMIFSCPDEYHFTSLELEAKFVGDDGNFQSSFFDLSAALFTEETKNQNRFVVRVPLEKLGLTVPAIYIATFKADIILDSEDPNISEEENSTEITDTAICSDVVEAYKCMMDDLFMSEKDSSCKDLVSDEVIRKYLLIYGHTAAMAARDLDTAQEYFRLIGNCFDKCGSKGRGQGSCCSGSCNGKH
jgi:hypothetical protein